MILYAVERDRLEELLEQFSKAEEVFSDYAIRQTEFLRDIRMKGDHLFKHGRNDFNFTKKGHSEPLFLNTPIDPEDDLYFDIL